MLDKFASSIMQTVAEKTIYAIWGWTGRQKPDSKIGKAHSTVSEIGDALTLIVVLFLLAIAVVIGFLFFGNAI